MSRSGEVPGKEQDSEGHGAIGDVEDGPSDLVHAHVDEIDDPAEPRAVDEVADGAAEDTPEEDAVSETPVRLAAEERQNHDDGEDGDEDERPPAPRKKAERRARVVHERETHDVPQERDRLSREKVRGRECLGELVGRDDGCRAPVEETVPSRHPRVAFASFSCFSWQSTQRPACGIASSRALPISLPHTPHVPYSLRYRRRSAWSTL